MKTTITLLLLSILATCSSFGQEISPELQKEVLSNRAHKQKRTARIMIAVGIPVTTLGVVAYFAEKNSKPDFLDFSGEFTAIAVAGAVMTLSSIPYFISSGVNKRKAQSIELTINTQPFINSEFHQLALKPQTSFKIAFNF